MTKPTAEEYGAFFQGYIDTASEDVISEIKEQETSFPTLLRSNLAKADYAYAEGKWTVKELLGHIIDTERIMAYRLLRISRKDTTPLPGFDQDEFMKYSEFGKLDMENLIQEFEAVRRSTLFLIDSLSEQQLAYIGNASGNPMSAKALVYIIAGHAKHHIQVMKEKYLQ
ncbi:DinB family protein [Desertivirga brevis]|uniref:DinB family protein n=1 Tax=Desertivirga brevis TaxID=2810310 RepID=UPI001A96F2C1|nr:DinB family protein [Pedobacter sp. SYSU D00873]